MNRPTAWLFALWSAYIATWAAVSGSSALVVAAWWLAGVCVAQALARGSAPSDATRRRPAESAERTSLDGD
jgi:hypothetical protein